jgi:hypothetical protein
VADITAVVTALNEGKAARRKRWSSNSCIYLDDQKRIMRRLARPDLGTHEIAVEIDWNDLTASDWILLEPAAKRQRRPYSIN